VSVNQPGHGRTNDAIKAAVALTVAATITFGSVVVQAASLSMDVFRTSDSVPAFAEDALGSRTACEDAPQAGPLSLRDALDRGLCNDPKVRAAWQDIKVKAAQLGQAKSAYLPTLSADYQAVRDNSSTDVHDHPNLSSSNHALIQTVDATANLVLWDFGSRAAASRAASEMVLSATAAYRASLQTSVATLAKDYFAALGAAGTASAARETVDAASHTALAAQARVQHGVAPISDQLQAQTSLQEAIYAAQKADSDLRAAKGILAIDMHQDPLAPMDLPDVHVVQQLPQLNGVTVREMLDDAASANPEIVSALAQLNAANAQVDKAKADGLPTISLTSKYTRNNQPASLGLGVPQYPATGHDWYVGIQVRIPLFEGFSRTYQIREAQAKAAEQEEAVRDAQKQVASGIWTDFETVTSSHENVESTQRLLEIAEQSFNVANRRYQMGAGSILEVLNAQGALSRARKEQVTSLADFGSATLQLASKLGRIRNW
jgi:outer membrane protein